MIASRSFGLIAPVSFLLLLILLALSLYIYILFLKNTTIPFVARASAGCGFFLNSAQFLPAETFIYVNIYICKYDKNA